MPSLLDRTASYRIATGTTAIKEARGTTASQGDHGAKSSPPSSTLSQPVNSAANIAESPLASAGIISRAIYSWMTPLVTLGTKRGLTPNDLPPHAREMQPQVILERFNAVWDAEVKRHGTKVRLGVHTGNTPTGKRILSSCIPHTESRSRPLTFDQPTTSYLS
jgi:hypothetical protein